MDTKRQYHSYDMYPGTGFPARTHGILVTLDAIFNRVIRTGKRKNGHRSFVMSLSVIRYPYSAEFL